MIRIEGNQFTVGSMPPPLLDRVGSMIMPGPAAREIDAYVEDQAWTIGQNFLILGEPMSGKTSTGLYLLRAITKAGHGDLNMVYWTEADFHADLRNLWRFESLVEKSANDTPLWQEYNEWERSFWDLKEATLLFMDDFGRGHTPNQRYEVETMLRRRRDLGLATIVAAEKAAWSAVPPTTRSLFKEGPTVPLTEVSSGGR